MGFFLFVIVVVDVPFITNDNETKSNFLVVVVK
jgi:hypothetical protein